MATDRLEFIAQSGEGRLQRDELLRGEVELGQGAGFTGGVVARGVVGALLLGMRLGPMIILYIFNIIYIYTK